jgi:hypothetical protein
MSEARNSPHHYKPQANKHIPLLIFNSTSNGTSNKLSEDGLQTVSLEEMNKYLAIELTLWDL